MEQYENLEIEIITFENTNVITDSLHESEGNISMDIEG